MIRLSRSGVIDDQEIRATRASTNKVGLTLSRCDSRRGAVRLGAKENRIASSSEMAGNREKNHCYTTSRVRHLETGDTVPYSLRGFGENTARRDRIDHASFSER